MTIEAINIPDMGAVEDVEVIEVCVLPGDTVKKDQSLIVLESDKASMEIPSPQAGKIVSINVAEGDSVAAGDAFMELEVSSFEEERELSSESRTEQGGIEQGQHITQEQVTESITMPINTRISENRPGKSVYAGPAVRLLAREMGVDLLDVQGSGPKARILKEDVQNYVKRALQRKSRKTPVGEGLGIPTVPEIDFAQFGEISIEQMSKPQRITAANMHRSWLNVPHVTQFDEVDISDLENFRAMLKSEAEQREIRLTLLPYLLKACAAALRVNPVVNASLHADGEQLVYKKFVHIGIAVDTPVGLMVPVIRDVDKKSIWDLAEESAELSKRARDRKLKPEEMQGGCFTISSLGNIGGTGFTPIVNTPEVGILGVAKIQIKPRWDGREFVSAKILPLSLSYDHRVVNGADAGRFMTSLGSMLSDIRRLSMT